VLRRHFRISAYEAEHEIPAWEREMLLRHFMEGRGGSKGSSEVSGDPFASVPEDLQGLG
jgi:hypothetical protein